MFYVFLADGFEETEAIVPVDIMRRAGIDVRTVGISKKEITGSHKIKITADLSDNDVIPDDNCQGIILPGGMPGTLNLEKSIKVQRFLDFADNHEMMIGAICAAPSILGHKGLLKGKRAVCFTGFEKDLLGALVLNEPVVTDGNIITACGAGAAMKFGFEIVKYIDGKEKADALGEKMLCDR